MNFYRQGFAGKAIFYFPFLVLGILLWLSFYCHPSAEDLAIHYYDQEKGLANYVSEFYRNDSSRYFSFPLTFALFNGDFFFHHYYLVPLLLIVAFWAGIYQLSSSVVRRFIEPQVSWRDLAWASTFLLLIFFSIVFDPATLFYWASGALTFLPGFILFLFLLSVLVRDEPGKKTGLGPTLVCIVLAVCICGTNEVSLYFLLSILVSGQLIHFIVHKKASLLVWILLACVVLCVLFLILPGGSANRAHGFKESYPFFTAVMNACVYTGRTLLRILWTPVSWLGLGGAFLLGCRAQGFLKDRISRSRLKPWPIIGLFMASVILLYFIVYFVSGELLPPRANGLVALYMYLFLLLMSMLGGVRSGQLLPAGLVPKTQKFIAGMILVVLLTNNLFLRGIQDLFAGYIYNMVLSGRVKEIEIARQAGKNTVTLKPYAEDFQERVSAIEGSALTRRILSHLGKTPQLIHYMDPLADTAFYIRYYAACYRIDTIQYMGRKFPRQRN